MASLNCRVDASSSEEQSSRDQRLRSAQLEEEDSGSSTTNLLEGETQPRPAADGAAEVGGVPAVGPEGDAGGSTHWNSREQGGKNAALACDARAQPGSSDGSAPSRPSSENEQPNSSATGPGVGIGAASAVGTNDASSEEGREEEFYDGVQRKTPPEQLLRAGQGADDWAANPSAMGLEGGQTYGEGGNDDCTSLVGYWNSPVLAPPPLPLCDGGHWVASPLGGENGQYPCFETPKKIDVDERDLLSFSPLVDFDQCPCSENLLSCSPFLGGESGQYPCPETPKKPSAAENALLDADKIDKENSPYHSAPGNARDLLAFSYEHGVTFWEADDLAGCPHRLARALDARDLYEQNERALFPIRHPIGQEYSDGGPILPTFIFDTSLPPTAVNLGLPEKCSPELARRIADGWLLVLKCRLFYFECPYHKNNDREIDYYRQWVWSLAESEKDFGTVLGLCGKPGNEVDLSCGANEGCLKKYNACHSVKSAKKILAALRDLVQLDEHSRFELNMPNFRANCRWTVEDVKSRGSLPCPLPTLAEMWAKAAIMNVMIWLCPQINIGNTLIDVSGTSKNSELLMKMLDTHGIDFFAGPYDHLQGFQTGRFPKAGDHAQNLSDAIVGYAEQKEVKLTTTFAAEVDIEELRRKCARHEKKRRDGQKKYHEMERIRKLPKRTPQLAAYLAAYDAERAAKGRNIGEIRAKSESELSTPDRVALRWANQANKAGSEAAATKRAMERERVLAEIRETATPDRLTPQRKKFDRTMRCQMKYFQQLGEERTDTQTDALNAYNAEQATKDAEKEAEKKRKRAEKEAKEQEAKRKKEGKAEERAAEKQRKAAEKEAAKQRKALDGEAKKESNFHERAARSRIEYEQSMRYESIISKSVAEICALDGETVAEMCALDGSSTLNVLVVNAMRKHGCPSNRLYDEHLQRVIRERVAKARERKRSVARLKALILKASDSLCTTNVEDHHVLLTDVMQSHGFTNDEMQNEVLRKSVLDVAAKKKGRK